MTITYHDNRLCFGSACLRSASQPGRGIDCDDSDLDRCFALLCEGNSVFVRNSLGIRRFRDYLKLRFQYVKAAGGWVVSPEGNCLLIHREGCWDLPKGMAEPGETLAAAALREVREETGIAPAAVRQLLAKTYHIYDKYGGWHLKQTSWYAMYAEQECPPVPQSEEGISEARWMPETQAVQLLQGSFASLRLLTQYITSSKPPAAI